MIYNVVFVLGVLQLDSFIHTYIYSLSDSAPIYVITDCFEQFPVLFSRSLLIIYFIYTHISVYMLIPTS